MKKQLCPQCQKNRLNGSGTPFGYQWWCFSNFHGHNGLYCWKCSEKAFKLSNAIDYAKTGV